MFGEQMGPEYGGFWRRAGALFLDGLFLVAVLGLGAWAVGFTSGLSIALTVLTQFSYFVLLVYRFGGTPGKLLVGLRITGLDGAPVTFSQAMVRASPDLFFGTVVLVGIAVASNRLGGLDIEALPRVERERQLATVVPWLAYVRALQTVWAWSELIVLLMNDKRRALHDFLAGTVVIVHRKSPAEIEPLPLDGGWRGAQSR